MLMRKGGRGEKGRMGQQRDGGRVIRGGEQRERTQLYDVWEGEVTFPLTFILAFFFSPLA